MSPVTRWWDQAQQALAALARDRHDSHARGSLGEAWSRLEAADRPDWLVQGRIEWLLPRLGGLPLHTERLVLRLPVPADAAAVFEMYRRPDVVRYLPFGTLTLDECADRVAAVVRPSITEEVFLARLVVDTGDRVVGELTLRVAGPAFSDAEVGWAFHPDVAGQGLATESARALLGLAFEELGMHRVHATLDARNHRSAALCERIGLLRETHTRADYWSKGEWTDTLGYGLVASGHPFEL